MAERRPSEGSGDGTGRAVASPRPSAQPLPVENQPYDESLELPETEEAAGSANRPRGSRRPGPPWSGGGGPGARPSGAGERSNDGEGGGSKVRGARGREGRAGRGGTVRPRPSGPEGNGGPAGTLRRQRGRRRRR